MFIKELLGKVTTYLIIIMFIWGVWDATNMVQGDIPWYKTVFEETVAGNPVKLIDAIKMGIGWSIITPVIHVSELPFFLQWYGTYYSLIIPSGFIPIPGVEIVIYLSVTFLILILPLAILVKRWRNNRAKRKNEAFAPLGLPIWFYPIIPLIFIMAYPFFVWFGLELFKYSAASFFSMSLSDAEAMWISFGQKTQSFSLVFILVSILGVYKGAKWSGKFWKG